MKNYNKKKLNTTKLSILLTFALLVGIVCIVLAHATTISAHAYTYRCCEEYSISDNLKQ